MTVEKLERVLWRIRTKHPDKPFITNTQLRHEIMLECGTDPRTHTTNRMALIRLKWIKAAGRSHIELTGADITGEEV